MYSYGYKNRYETIEQRTKTIVNTNYALQNIKCWFFIRVTLNSDGWVNVMQTITVNNKNLNNFKVILYIMYYTKKKNQKIHHLKEKYI